MAALEEEGLIAQPHTSAGRIPTDKGYRLFVDRLSTVKPLSAPEKKAIASLLDGAVDLDDTVDRTVRLLAQLTHQVAVVQYPSLTRSTVRHVELVPLGGGAPARGAHHEHRPGGAAPRRRGGEPSEAVLADLRARLNVAVGGKRLTEVRALIESLPSAFAPDARQLVRLVLDALEGALAVEREERIVLAGTANLARAGTDFAGSIGPVLEALEEQVVLLQAAHRDGRRHRRRRGADRPREPPRRARRDRRRGQRLRGRGRGGGAARRARPYPDGLPHDDRGRARRRALRVADPGVMIDVQTQQTYGAR